MATNLNLDDRLILRAKRAGKHKTKKEAVTAALEDYVKKWARLRILDHFGTVEYYPDYDYKALRKSKRIPR